ncbi:MAG: NADH-quinone oxidoreductase subunit K [Rhodocyclaceae bacterium]|nr:NADH-quinone oxidoreductase subunit K [Rhodocyclaceae bacterium]
MVTTYLVFAGLFFFIGLYALLTGRNMIRLLIGLEIMTKAVVLVFIMAGYARGEEFLTQSYIITFIVVEVTLMAVALALVITAYRNTGSLDVRGLARLKG